MSMSTSMSTSTFTEMTTSVIDVHSFTSTSTTGSVQLTEDVVTQVISSSPASVQEDIWGDSQVINLSSSGNFTRVDMSTGGTLPGIASYSRPMTVAHEAHRPNVQRFRYHHWAAVSLTKGKWQCSVRKSFKCPRIHKYIIYL